MRGRLPTVLSDRPWTDFEAGVLLYTLLFFFCCFCFERSCPFSLCLVVFTVPRPVTLRTHLDASVYCHDD